MFYRAKVEDNKDPKMLGRVKVRIYGIHSQDSIVSNEDLPWAEVAGGTDFGLVDGVGVTSILRVGTMVWVFLNNDDSNFPVIFAVVKGKADVNSIAKGSYTDIATIKTASGHIIELNDSGGGEKIEIQHKSGSKVVLQPDGSILIESVNNMVHNVTGDYTMQIGGKLDIKTGANTTIDSGGGLGITAAQGTDMTSSGSFKLTASRIDLN